MCESAEKAIESDRSLRASLKLQEDPVLIDWLYKGWKTKDHLISELTNRILVWNEMKRPECHANLKGKGPQVLNEHEVKYYQDDIVAGDGSETAAQSKTSDAATRLREILTKSQKGRFLGFLCLKRTRSAQRRLSTWCLLRDMVVDTPSDVCVPSESIAFILRVWVRHFRSISRHPADKNYSHKFASFLLGFDCVLDHVTFRQYSHISPRSANFSLHCSH